MNVEIRPGRPDDLESLLALEQSFPGDRLSRRALRRLLRSASARVWVAQDEQGLLGALILLTRRGSRSGRIYSLAVDARARRRGVASALLQAAHAAAEADGLHEIRLEVREDNAEARAFYDRHGYTLRCRLPGYYDDGGDGLRLRRMLTG